jgi:hypothetical protein
MPAVRALGLQADANPTAQVEFKAILIIIVGVWILSGFVNSLDRHENALVCVLNSLGLPGLVLAVLFATAS